MADLANTVHPAPGYILVAPQKRQKTTASGIVLPDSSDDKPQQGKVLSVGDDFISDYGTKKSAPVKVGDVVVYREWGGKEYKEGEEEVLILKFEDVMATIK
jgi:chaperonin GroES